MFWFYYIYQLYSVTASEIKNQFTSQYWYACFDFLQKQNIYIIF